MSLNLVLAYEASALAAPPSFRDAMQAAANIFDSLILNNITVTIRVGYGDWNNQFSVPSTAAEGGDLVGVSESYATLRAALASHETSAADQTFVNSLPSTSSITGVNANGTPVTVSSFYVPSAVAKALGQISPTNSTVDGAVGFGTGIPTTLLVGVALHEFSHALGREPGVGPFDLFRYTSPGQHLFSGSATAPAAYFSIDGGQTDLADFGRTSDSSDFLNRGVQGANDPFNEFYSSSTLQNLTAVDKELIDVLGFNTTPGSITVSATSSKAQQGGAAVTLLSGAPTITDAASSTLASATIKITSGSGSGSAVAGDKLYVNGQQSGTVDGGLVAVSWNDSTKVLTLTGTASISAYQTLLSQVSYQDTGTDSSTGSHPQRTVSWTANDGSSSFSAASQIAIERSPVVTASNVMLNAGYMLVAATSLFSASDPDNDAIVTYGFKDTGTGHFVLGGTAQPNNIEIDVTASQLPQLSYQNAPGTDTVQIRASDGTMWSNWASFTVTGPAVKVVQTDGPTSLTEVGNHFYLFDSNGLGPSLKIGGMDFVAGQFGAWTPIGAAMAAGGGYEVAWKNGNADQYTVWNTNSNGNYTSSVTGWVPGSDVTLESLEPSFQQDLNGDGVIGLRTTVLEAHGSTSLVQVGSNYFLYPVGGSSGPSLKFGGMDVVAGQFGAWTPIGAEATASGYEIAWKNGTADQYTVWNTNSSGNYTSSAIGVVSGSSVALASLEGSFQQDLNDDGLIGPSAIFASRVATGLTQPLFAGAPAGDTGRLFIVEKTGRIKILDLASGQVLATPFLDLSGQIDTSGERGLLGLAFDPNFATNGFVYVDVSNPNGNNDIRRYHVDPTNPNVVDLTSATPILSINQSTFNNHKGGWLGFGPDGDLYISVGDGGGGGNPLHTGQNIDSLLGKILRIDVHSPSDPGLNYHIPSDNPFVGTPGADEEIFAYGLRNPWRASFDRALGTFYIADVGQDSWEEIDIGQKGANYGWNTYEGPVAFPGGDPLNPAGPSVSPIYSYDHSVGHSITGGYVYRGEGEGLQGQYFFADFIQSKVFTLRFDGSSWVATDRTAQIVTDAGTIHNPDSFGEDARGNLYIVDYDGNIFKLTPSKLLPTVIEAHGSTSLVQVGNNYFLYPVGGSSGPELSFGGAPVVAGQFAAWMPIAAEVTAKGYEVAWKNGSADQYTVWNTNSSGNYTSSVTGWVPGNNLTLESLEPSFQQALNNDGTIGPPPPPPPTVIESKGATDLDQVGSNYFLYAHGTTNGPELSFGGMPVVAGQFGAWTPIGAEVMANGRYEVAWKNGSADQYTVWNTDSGGNYASNVVGWVLGNNLTLESLEPSFQQDLNGDGTIGPPPPPPPTVIESKGATDLDQVGSNYFLYAHGTTNGPELSFGGMPVVAGQFGPWTPIGAEVMASGGYEVAWKNGSADQYTVWNTNSSGSFISSIAIVSGANATLVSLEPSFQQDLNGDGFIGGLATSEFSLPTSGAGPFSIALGPDGNVWFTEVNGNKIGEITPSDVISEFSVSGSPGGIIAGTDGAMWFTEIGGNKIGRLNISDHALQEFTIPTAGAFAHEITIDANGNVWFAEAGTDKIGKLNLSTDVITEFSLPNPGGRAPFDIVAGLDGNMWFTEIHGDMIGKITPAGAITEFAVHMHPSYITAGPDGALWFSESDTEKSDNVNLIGRITTNGTFTEFSPPTAGSKPQGITVGPDGALWFTEAAGNNIGRVTTDGHFSEYAIPTAGSLPFGIVTGLDRHIWFAEFSGNKIGEINLPDPGPTVTASNVTASPGQSFAASSLFSCSDLFGAAVINYQFSADVAAGSFVLTVNGAEQFSQVVSVSAAQLPQLTFQSGLVTGGNFSVLASDDNGQTLVQRAP